MDLFGHHGIPIQSPDHLTGRFNGHLKGAVALFVDEAFFVGDRQGNDRLKSLITEDRIMIEAKYSEAMPVRNRLKIMMATNADHAIPAGIDERRFFVTRVSDRKKQDHAYFAELKSWWQGGGDRALLALLQRIDLSDFNIRKVPRTRALDEQKLQSLTGLDAWLYGLLQKPANRWTRRCTADELAARFEQYCNEKGLKYEQTSAAAVSKGVRNWLDVERERENAGERKWFLILPEWEEARRQFEEKLGVVVDWDG